MAQLKSRYDQAIAQISTPGAPFETRSQIIDGTSYTVFKNVPRTLSDVYREAAQHQDKEFLVYEGERWTFAGLLQQAATFGQQLITRFGIQKGDRVAIAMRNYPEWMSAFIGITSIGAVVVPLNSWGQARELEFALSDSGANAVFCDQPRLDAIAECLTSLDIQAVVVRPQCETLPENTVTAEQFIAGSESVSIPAVDISTDDTAMIMYTSGTTGKPKGAVSTHRAICQAIANFDCAAMASAMSNPKLIAGMMAKGFEPAQMLAVPLFHVSGCHAVFLTALKAGRKIVILYKWDVEQALRYIESERVTILSAAPSMLTQLLESPLYDQTDTSSLCSLGAGGSATTPRTSKLIEEKVPDGYPGTGWGLTETNGIGTAFTGAPFKNKPRSAGFVHATAQVSVRDDQGAEVAQGEPGQLWIKSVTVATEYWNRPDATAKEFRDGWFDSGDVGYFDADGYLYLSDRAKDMVIRGGENIYPAEIEGVIHDHPKIEEAAAFGVDDEAMGEKLIVAAVPKSGATLDEAEVIEFAKQNLARFKVPQHVWVMTQPLPRTASGKVIKKDLKSSYLEQR